MQLYIVADLSGGLTAEATSPEAKLPNRLTDHMSMPWHDRHVRCCSNFADMVKLFVSILKGLLMIGSSTVTFLCGPH